MAYNYTRCFECGHEQHQELDKSLPILNDEMSINTQIQPTALDRFKIAVTLKIKSHFKSIVDIGTGPGFFLHFISKYFQSVQGLELTHECVKFARESLKLDIVDNPKNLQMNEPLIVTFWHSLEHIPFDESSLLLQKIPVSSRVLISVPNANSLQYKLFGPHWPYFDKEAHIYQFSSRSLDLYLKSHHFTPTQNFYSFVYITFGFMQGFINSCFPIRNYFYMKQKRGVDFNLPASQRMALDIYNYLLIFIFIGPTLFCSLLEFIFKNKAGVITRCYQKNLST